MHIAHQLLEGTEPRPAEAINALLQIAHDEQAAVCVHLLLQLAEDLNLNVVRILKLIDEQISALERAKLLRALIQHLLQEDQTFGQIQRIGGMHFPPIDFLRQDHDLFDQIVEIRDRLIVHDAHLRPFEPL